jgi:protein-disulfide isomerase
VKPASSAAKLVGCAFRRHRAPATYLNKLEPYEERKTMTRKSARVLIPVLSLLLPAITAWGQLDTTDKAASSNSRDDAKQVQAGSVTINMPEGITKDQADAILSELRQIRQLLEKEQGAGSQAAGTPVLEPAQKVNLTLSKGMYSLGRDDAPLTLIEFADYQCPFCGRFHSDTFADLKKNYIDTGKVRFVSRDLPLSFHPNALNAAEGARCAGEQGKFWEMRDKLIANAEDLSKPAILKYAQALSLDMGKFSPCLEKEAHKDEIQKDLDDASSAQISGTPTFVLGKTSNDNFSGTVIAGAQPYSVFQVAIQNMLGSGQ